MSDLTDTQVPRTTSVWDPTQPGVALPGWKRDKCGGGCAASYSPQPPSQAQRTPQRTGGGSRLQAVTSWAGIHFEYN